MNCSIEIDKTKYFLGYHYGVGEVLSLNIAPQPGMFFVNGETNSVWVWNTLNREWIDTNRVDSGMKGMLTNEVGNSPDDFIPSPQTGVKESYFYVAECDDVDVNPNATPKTITFLHFKNGSSAVSVTLKKTSIVILYWNGDYWETSIIPMNVNWSLLRTEINEIADKVGLYLYKDITVKGNTSPNIFSLEPYIGKEVSVKVSGNFTSFGYRDEALANGYRTLGESEKRGKWVNFYVPETATTFFVFNNTDLGVTTVDVEFRANLSADLFLNEVSTKGCVFMSLGDSITTESYYVPKLRDILQPSKYYNLAVAGAWWADREGTVYDGNPQFNGADNNVNNVIGNQVQKIINNPTLYADAPDIIIISAGTNDSENMRVANNATIQEIREAIDANYRNEAGVIPVTEPTFDENDTYHSYRKTIGGAMRYCVNRLQELFPRAKIYILTPIQGCYASRDYASSIATKQEYISESAKHLGVPVIHVGEECGISADFEYEGAMWNGPTGYHERSGRDLIDGLHPNTNGSKKMADYIALNIVSSFKTNGKIYSVVGSSLSVTGIVDGNTLKL